MFQYKRKMSHFLLSAIPLLRLRTTENQLLQIAPIIFRNIRLASSTPPVRLERLDDGIYLRTLSQNAYTPRDDKPLVVVFEFIQAKPRLVDKYASIYLSQGFDVVTVQNKFSTMLSPKKSRSLVKQILTLLARDPRLTQRSMAIKAMSGGSFMYSEMMLKLESEPDRWPGVRDNCVCLISDSMSWPADFPNGISRSFTKINVVQKVLEAALTAALKVLHEPIIKHYIRGAEVIHDNPLNLPSLVFYSKDDLLANAYITEKMMTRWQEKGIPVTTCYWDKSKHVGHLQMHPEEYVAAVTHFLDAMFPLAAQSREKCRQ